MRIVLVGRRGVAKADDEDRWITVHPHGPGSEGQPVHIEVDPHNPRIGRVIGGAGGRLNYKVFHIKTKEEYQAAAREKRKNKSKSKDTPSAKKAKKTMSDERASARAGELSKLAETMRSAGKSGWEESDLAPKEEDVEGMTDKQAGSANRKHTSAMLGKAKHAIRSARKLFVDDREALARAANGGEQAGHIAIQLKRDADRVTRGYTEVTVDVPDSVLRDERARALSRRIDDAKKRPDGDAGEEIVDISSRLASSKSITSHDLQVASPEELAGYCRTALKNQGVSDEKRAILEASGQDPDEHEPEREEGEDEEVEHHIDAVRDEISGSLEDALAFSRVQGNREALLGAAMALAERGMLDPDKAKADRDGLAVAKFDALGAPRPNEVSAEDLGELDEHQLRVLAEDAAPRLRSMTIAGTEAREVAARVVSLADEGLSRHDMGPDVLREFLGDAIEVGAIGVGARGVRREKEEESAPRPDTNIKDPALAAKLLNHDDTLRRIDRAHRNAVTRINRGLEVGGFDYDQASAPVHAVRGAALASTVSEDQVRRIEQDVKTEAARSYLSTYHKLHGDVPDAASIDVAERDMFFHQSSGAAVALNDHAVTFFGRPVMDRQAIDTLGVDAAAKVLAWHLHNSDPSRAEARAEAVGEYHVNTQIEIAKEAEGKASALYKEARNLHAQMTEGHHEVDAVLERSSERIDKLKRARQIMGETLGRLEATASLHMAMSQSPPKEVSTSLGQTPVDAAVRQLAALGLKPEDYTLDHDGTNTFLSVKEGGFHKLVSPLPKTAADLQTQRVHMGQIRAGADDEEGWVPPFFSRRAVLPPSGLQAGEGRTFSESIGDNLAKYESVEDALTAHIGQRALDGQLPEEIQADLLSQETQNAIPQELRGEFGRVLNQALPPHDKSGYRRLADRMKANIGDAAERFIKMAGLSDEDVAQTTHGQKLSDEFVGDAVFRALSKTPAGVAAFKESADLTRGDRAALKDFYRRRYGLTEEQIRANETKSKAMKVWRQQNPEPDKMVLEGESSGPQQLSLDRPAPTGGAGELRAQLDKDRSRLDSMSSEGVHAELRELNIPPAGSKSEAVDLILRNRHNLTKNSDWLDWDKARKDEAANYPTDGRRDVEWAEFRKVHWADAVESAKRAFINDPENVGNKEPDEKELAKISSRIGRADNLAFAAVADAVKHQFFGEVAGNYESLTTLAGSPHPVARGSVHVRGYRANSVFSDEHGALKEQLKELNKENARRPDGRWGHQVALDEIKKTLDGLAAGRQQQGGLSVGSRAAVAERGDVRTHLGTATEDQIAKAVMDVGTHVRPDAPFSAMAGVSMGDARVYQQRAIKSATRAGRMGLFADMGSGKTVMAIGAFCDAHALEGGPKRGLFVVPGKVRGQFDATALAFVDPSPDENGNTVDWFFKPNATQEDRLEAYKDGPNSKKMVFVSHEDVRSDVTRMVHTYLTEREGLNISMEDAVAMVGGSHDDAWSSEDDGDENSQTLPNIVKSALEHHKADSLMDALFLDEGHRALNRQGKKDSHFARVMDALSSKSTRFLDMTGTSVKNDLTEAFDMARKIRPDLYGTPSEAHPHRMPSDEFLRRHSGDEGLWGPALRQEMDPFTFTVSSGEVQKTMADVPSAKDLERWHVVSPSPEQKHRLEEIDRAVSRLRVASREGRVDVDSAKALVPAKFDGLSEGQAEEEARKLISSPGAISFSKNAATDHAINQHPKSAKVREILKYVGKGGGGSGKPGIVFARNVATAHRIVDELRAQGGKLVGFMGAGNPRAVEKAKSDFMEGRTNIVVLTDACSEGIDGLQHRAKWLIQHDTPDTHMRHAQRSRRLYRPGVSGSPEMVTLLLDVPQEHRDMERVKKKAALLEAVQGPADESGFAGYMRKAGLA